MAKRKEISTDVRKLVIKFLNEGKSMAKVGEILNLSKSTVQTILNNYKKNKSFESLPRTGRPLKLDERIRRKILREVTENPKKSSIEIKNDIKRYYGIEVHADTVRRCLKKSGLQSCIARKKPYISHINKKKRFDYATKYKDAHLKDSTFWEKVIFTDECKFNLFGNDGRARVWRKRGTSLEQKNVCSTVKHGGGSVMVWGCMSADGVGKLRFIDGIMNSRGYIDILKNDFLPSVEKLNLKTNFIFMHDNDPKHTSGLVKEWLLKNVKSKLPHPPQSPDLNVIEHLWAHLKQKLKNRRPSSIAQLKVILQEEWENIPTEVTKNLVSSMPKRLKEVFDAKGGHTSH